VHQGNFFVEAALNLRFKIKRVFERLLDSSQEGMISAMVLGDRGGIARDLKQVFVNTGTAHIIAISGMNMSIIAVIVFFIFKCFGFSRRWQLITTSLFLFTYAFITGWSPSVVRASLMASVFLFSFAWELEGDAINSLGLAAFVLLLMDSTHLFDIGFQLSFAAVLAILLLFKPCERMLAFLPKLLATPMAVSLAAWVGTAPFIFYHFNMITPVSIIANIPIVPLADLTVALGLGLGVTGLVGDWLAIPFAGCLKAVFNLMVILASWFDKIPLGHFNVG
jgi:competence protein ComEC